MNTYNPKSKKAQDFINDAEILDTLTFLLCLFVWEVIIGGIKVDNELSINFIEEFLVEKDLLFIKEKLILLLLLTFFIIFHN